MKWETERSERQNEVGKEGYFRMLDALLEPERNVL